MDDSSMFGLGVILTLTFLLVLLVYVKVRSISRVQRAILNRLNNERPADDGGI